MWDVIILVIYYTILVKGKYGVSCDFLILPFIMASFIHRTLYQTRTLIISTINMKILLLFSLCCGYVLVRNFLSSRLFVYMVNRRKSEPNNVHMDFFAVPVYVF